MAVLGSGRVTYEVSGENWGNLPEGWFYKEATSVDVDSKDNVYVFNRGNHPMIVFDREGEVLRSWGEGAFTNPHGVTVAPDDTIWLVDNGDHSIRHFTKDGKLLLTIAEGHKQSPLMSGKPVNGPTRVAIDPRNGEILVADGYGNARVHRFSADGEKLLRSWGESGTDPGQFNIVHDIESDTDGRIYVADRENHRVQIFDTEGKYLDQWKNMHRACGIYLDLEEGICYIGELGTDLEVNQSVRNIGPRLSLYDLKGNLLARFGDNGKGEDPGQFVAPHGIVVDSRKDIYVAEVSYSQLGRRLDPPREVRSFRKLVRKKKPS